jgi:sensory box protein
MDAEHAKVEAVLEAQEKSQSVVTLVETVGHPLNRLTEENKALDALIEVTKVKVASKTATVDDVNEVRQVSIHYAKKGDLLYPHLKVLTISLVHPWLCGLLMAIFAMALVV